MQVGIKLNGLDPQLQALTIGGITKQVNTYSSHSLLDASNS